MKSYLRKTATQSFHSPKVGDGFDRLMTRWRFGSVGAVNELQTPREDVSLQNLKSHQDSVSTNRVTVTGNTSTRRSFSIYNLVIETF